MGLRKNGRRENIMRIRNYKECIDYLYSLERAGIKYTLDNIRKLSEAAGNPHQQYKSIHIAGTNGKGATASIISSVLKESGYKIGLYTSPHVKDFRERISVNGKLISKEYVLNFTNKYYNVIEKVKPSFFEVTTAMAFAYFADCGAEIAVIECGLGGRLDSTNIIRPEVSIITSISIDHSEYLGNTIKSIALEKAGIVKRGIPCVTGSLSDYSKRIIKNVCKEKKAEYTDSSNYKVEYRKTENGFAVTINGNYEEYEYPLNGVFQVLNLKTALTSLNVLKNRGVIEFNNTSLRKGLRNIKLNTKYGYRFEEVSKHPRVILDVSHNAEGLSNLKENLIGTEYNNLYIVFGMMADKETKKCINELEKLKGFLILTKPDYKRADSPEKLAKHVNRKSECVIKNNIKTAFEYAKRKAGRNDLILVTGSFFMVSDFLKHFKEYDKSNNI